MPNRRERQLQLSHEMDTLEREEARERAAASQPSESSQLEQPETPVDLTHPSPSHVPTALLIDLDP